MIERVGGCQCGAVRYRLKGDPLAVLACHCTECQRQSGSAFGMSMMVRRDAFVIEQGTLKVFERSSDSGRPVRCAFCPDCGTRIYHEPQYIQGIVNVKPGTLDDTSWLRPTFHGWTRSRQAWVTIPEGVMQHPTQP